MDVLKGVTARKRHYVQRTVRRLSVLNRISYRTLYCVPYRTIVQYVCTFYKGIRNGWPYRYYIRTSRRSSR